MLVTHVHRLDVQFYGLEKSQLGKLAFDFAKTNEIQPQFIVEKGTASNM